MKVYLFSSLGNYELVKPCCVVFVNNLFVHMTEEFLVAIISTGSLLTYAYSPHLNPFETYFSLCTIKLIWKELRVECLVVSIFGLLRLGKMP